MRTRSLIRFDSFRLVSIRFGSKSSASKSNFLFFFQIFMIRFDLIELHIAIYPNKALDSIDSMQKRLLARVRFGRTRENLKKN